MQPVESTAKTSSTPQFGGLIFTNWTITLILLCLNSEARAWSNSHSQKADEAVHTHRSHTPLLRSWWWRALCSILKRFLCRENLLCVIINVLQETWTLIIHFSAKTNWAEIVGVSLTELTVDLFCKPILLSPWNRDTLVYTVQKRRLWTHLLISPLWEGFRYWLKHSKSSDSEWITAFPLSLCSVHFANSNPISEDKNK